MESTIPLLEKFYAGDTSALDALLASHLGWLRNYVSRKMSNQLRVLETSEDVVQEVLSSLLERGPAFVPEDDSQFRRLIGTIVLNRLRDRNDYVCAARRDWRRRAGGDAGHVSRIGVAAESLDSPSMAAMRSEEAGHLHLAIELLPPDDAHIILRRRWDGAEFEDIGRELDMTGAAVQRRHLRAVRKLGTMLRNLKDGDLTELEEDPVTGS
ncbi:MAG: RNA polymerase sigma factor (sigma-70 family) [Planctomycetota bacterium]|jgi:RNA polymerase sigma factor (sigma-70 family)